MLASPRRLRWTIALGALALLAVALAACEDDAPEVEGVSGGQVAGGG